MIFLRACLLWVWLWFVAVSASAHLTSDFDVTSGYLNMEVAAGNDFNQIYDSLFALEFNYCINFSGPNISFTMSFFEVLQSDFGPISFTRIALGTRWYVTGFNGKRTIYDSSTQGRIFKPAPFVGLNVGLGTLAVNTSASLDRDFNATVVDAKGVIGVDIPITFRWMLTGQFGIHTSLLGGSSVTENNISRQASYQGFSMLVGVRAATFE